MTTIGQRPLRTKNCLNPANTEEIRFPTGERNTKMRELGIECGESEIAAIRVYDFAEMKRADFLRPILLAQYSAITPSVERPYFRLRRKLMLEASGK